MNLVLEYAARSRRRGTVYGTASMVMAGLVLATPLATMLMNDALQYLMRQPPGTLPSLQIRNWVIDGPMLATVGLPLIGLLFGGIGLSLRCKRDRMVFMGVLVNIAGLIAALAVVCLVG